MYRPMILASFLCLSACSPQSRDLKEGFDSKKVAPLQQTETLVTPADSATFICIASRTKNGLLTEFAHKEITVGTKEDITTQESATRRFFYESPDYDIYLGHANGEIEIQKKLKDAEGKQTGSKLAFVVTGSFSHVIEGDDGEFAFIEVSCKPK
jgi:hypothetical protein